MWKDGKDAATGESVRGNIAAYREAVEDFSKSATEFLKCVPMLLQTRDAYARAMSISAEVRKILDTGDETLGRLMSQIEEAVNVQLANRSEKKKPEIAKIETIHSVENSSNSKALP